jgi:hypothetical protein
MRVATSPFIGVLSVLRFGIVHVSVTLSPFRVADKSPTGSARFSDGGCGAPGVPHPESSAQSTTASAGNAFRSIELIAFQSNGAAQAACGSNERPQPQVDASEEIGTGIRGNHDPSDYFFALDYDFQDSDFRVWPYYK